MMDELNQSTEQTMLRADLPEMDISYLLRIIQQQDLAPKKFLDVVLNQATALSGSQFGYVFFYDEGLQVFSLHAWSQKPGCCLIAKHTMQITMGYGRTIGCI